MKKDKLFFVTLLFLFVKGFIINHIGYFDILNLLADVLVVITAFRTPKLHYKHLLKFTGKPVVYSLSLFLTVGVLADLFNFIPVKTSLWGVKNFLRFFLLTYAILGRYRFLNADLFKKLISKLFLINIFAVLVDYTTGRKGDDLGGIFLGNGDLAIFLVISLLFFTSDCMQGKLSKFFLAFAYVVSFAIAMFAEIKFLYLVIPMCFYLSYIFIKKTTILNIIFFASSCLLIVPTLKYALSLYYTEEYVEAIFSEEQRSDYLQGEGYSLGLADVGFNRNTSIAKTQILFLKDLQTSLIGHGIGSASNSSTFGTWIAESYRLTGYFFFTSSFVLIETGWIGYILFLSIYLFILLRFLSFYVKGKNSMERYWAAMGTMMAIVTFLFIWYNSAPYVDYYLPFMLWGFCLLGIFQNKKVIKR